MPYKDLAKRRAMQRILNVRPDNLARRKVYAVSSRGKFVEQRAHAGDRGIEWKLTYEEWLAVWGDKLPARGATKGKLCMARRGDTGAYEVGNVFLQEFGANVRNARTGVYA